MNTVDLPVLGCPARATVKVRLAVAVPYLHTSRIYEFTNPYLSRLTAPQRYVCIAHDDDEWATVIVL